MGSYIRSLHCSEDPVTDNCCYELYHAKRLNVMWHMVSKDMPVCFFA
jgi:hypothetical protein